jgi:hypothetical protein
MSEGAFVARKLIRYLIPESPNTSLTLVESTRV